MNLQIMNLEEMNSLQKKILCFMGDENKTLAEITTYLYPGELNGNFQLMQNFLTSQRMRSRIDYNMYEGYFFKKA